ncbi:MAG: hypothetical protein ACD_61C00221G0003 [uncultured bacterium]|nr:MAG: hypothetical protein ACD_61C00221G0003 [uncultured bacterium]
MKSIYRLATTGLVCLLVFCRVSIVFAVTNPVTGTASVSATVPDLSFNPPTLLTPAVNATLNTVRPSFSWLRPSPTPASPLSYYDFYLDGAVFAASVSDSLVSQSYYFYTASASGGIFNISLKTNLSQGYHTWQVIAFTENGISSASETRTFYIDSYPPFISVTKIDKHTLDWSTADPISIPPLENRYLFVSTPDPIIGGKVEASSNIQIILMCPQNIPTCQTQIFTGNISSGLWETHFFGLLPGHTYPVAISATDAAGNTTVFPEFYLTFGTTLFPTASPSASVTPSLILPSISLTPPTNLLNIITPGPYIPRTPPSPTPPPPALPKGPLITLDRFYLFLLILMIFGLPLHLLMTTIGARTPVRFVCKFLLILAFPFLRRKMYQTVPFCFIDIFISDKLDHPWQSVVSDINGNYRLRSPIPEKILIEISAVGRSWKDALVKGSIIPVTCLVPLLTSPQDSRTRLLKGVYDNRVIPIIIALLTSTTAFIIKPSYFILIYLYFTLQYLFSEYIYPKI